MLSHHLATEAETGSHHSVMLMLKCWNSLISTSQPPMIRSTGACCQFGTRWSTGLWRTGMTWRGFGSMFTPKSNCRLSQRRWAPLITPHDVQDHTLDIIPFLIISSTPLNTSSPLVASRAVDWGTSEPQQEQGEGCWDFLWDFQCSCSLHLHAGCSKLVSISQSVWNSWSSFYLCSSLMPAGVFYTADSRILLQSHYSSWSLVIIETVAEIAVSNSTRGCAFGFYIWVFVAMRTQKWMWGQFVIVHVQKPLCHGFVHMVQYLHQFNSIFDLFYINLWSVRLCYCMFLCLMKEKRQTFPSWFRQSDPLVFSSSLISWGSASYICYPLADGRLHAFLQTSPRKEIFLFLEMRLHSLRDCVFTGLCPVQVRHRSHHWRRVGLWGRRDPRRAHLRRLRHPTLHHARGHRRSRRLTVPASAAA